jgi:hypothetical protein
VPLSYKIDADRNVADVLGVGTVTLDESLKTIRTVAADLAHHQCGCLTDIRQMDYFPPVMELKEIAFELIRLRNAFRCGIVFIVSNDRHYALGRFLSALVDSAGVRIGVFRERKAGEKWLTDLREIRSPATGPTT